MLTFLLDARDEELTVTATDKGGWVVVTHDREFSQRRLRQAIGRHLHLRCEEWLAAELLEARLSEVVGVLQPLEQVTLQLSQHGLKMRSSWD